MSTLVYPKLAEFDSGLSTDTISEYTSAAGVTVDGVLLKDGGATFADAATVEMGNAGIIATGTTAADDFIIKAMDTGVGVVEVAKVQGAADPYFSLGGSQANKFYYSGGVELGGAYETQTGAWADPASPTGNGDTRHVYNSTQAEYRTYIYMNSGWRSVEVS